MRFFLSIILLVFAVTEPFDAFATHYPSARIRRYATNTPRKVENNLNVLVDHLVKPLDDNYDKAKMIAYWIASHIYYDEYLYTNGADTKLLKKHDEQEPDKLLKTRSGICSEFAELFAKMCRIAGIKSGIAYGYAYPSTVRPSMREKRNYGHAWNYFNYKGRKVYVDTTFMSRGSLQPTGGIREYAHKRALRSFENNNKLKSQVNDFDDFYFDFSYSKEKRERGYVHKED